MRHQQKADGQGRPGYSFVRVTSGRTGPIGLWSDVSGRESYCSPRGHSRKHRKIRGGSDFTGAVARVAPSVLQGVIIVVTPFAARSATALTSAVAGLAGPVAFAVAAIVQLGFIIDEFIQAGGIPVHALHAACHQTRLYGQSARACRGFQPLTRAARTRSEGYGPRHTTCRGVFSSGWFRGRGRCIMERALSFRSQHRGSAIRLRTNANGHFPHQDAVEEIFIIASFLKWTVLAAMVGALIGVSVSLFLKALEWGISLRPEQWWSVLLLPPAGYFVAWLIHRFAPDAEGHGTEAVIRAIHQCWGKIRASVVPVKAIATITSLAVGASAGKEGPSAQIGSGVASVMADLLGLGNADRRKLVVCGISAGFASVFGLPVAGTLFGIEVLAIGAVSYEYLLPSFISGVTSFVVAQRLGITYHKYVAGVPDLNEIVLVKLLLFGALVGLVALLFIKALDSAHTLFGKLPMRPPMKAAVGGATLALLYLLVGSSYMGLSLDLLNAALTGSAVAATAFLWKIVATSLTLGAGWSGGIITPIFVVGATAGSVMGPWLGFSPQFGAALGMVGLLAAAANTPIAAILMGVEMFGTGIGAAVAAVAIAAFLVVGHHSVYPSQILALRKAELIRVHLNRPLEENTEIEFHPRTYLFLWRRWARRLGHPHRHHS